MQRTLLHVLALTVNGQYEELEKLTDGKRASAEVIKQSIEEWPEKANPHHFIMPPDQAFNKLVPLQGRTVKNDLHRMTLRLPSKMPIFQSINSTLTVH